MQQLLPPKVRPTLTHHLHSHNNRKTQNKKPSPKTPTLFPNSSQSLPPIQGEDPLPRNPRYRLRQSTRSQPVSPCNFSRFNPFHNLFPSIQGHSSERPPSNFRNVPQILTSNIKTELNPVFAFISNELGVADHNFRKVINKCPRLLVCSVRDQLKPALFYLHRLGFRDFEALAYSEPVLFASSVENTLKPKLEFLMGLGFTKVEAIEMVLRCPSLFTFSIENNFKPKIEYFIGEMKGKLEDLKEFPQYFAFSLEKRIKPRHFEVSEIGVDIPLPVLLKSTDQEFNELLRKTY